MCTAVVSLDDYETKAELEANIIHISFSDTTNRGKTSCGSDGRSLGTYLIPSFDETGVSQTGPGHMSYLLAGAITHCKIDVTAEFHTNVNHLLQEVPVSSVVDSGE